MIPEILLAEHDSIPKNRKLAEAFFYMGLIERWGSGTIRIASELQTAGHPLPKFESQSGRFQVTFFKQLSILFLREQGLSERQILAIQYLKEHDNISNAEYQSLTQTSKRTSSRET